MHDVDICKVCPLYSISIQDIIDWYLVIRQAKIMLLNEKYGVMDDKVVS